MKFILVFTLIFLSCFTFKTNAMKGSASVENQAKEQIEVITVLGQYSPLHFKKEMRKVELDFYSLYNELMNEKDSQFAIRCRRNAPTGSFIIKTTCKPQYQINIEHRMATSMLNGSLQTLTSGGSSDFSDAGGGATTTLNVSTGGNGYYNSLLKKENKKALKFTENLLKESPELRVKLQEYVDAKMHFEKIQEEYKSANR